jgi:hypothetical protein
MLCLTPKEALEKYGNKLFLYEDEIRDYMLQQANRNPSEKMLVLVLSGLRRHTRPTKFKKPISMAGRYLTREYYTDLLG